MSRDQEAAFNGKAVARTRIIRCDGVCHALLIRDIDAALNGTAHAKVKIIRCDPLMSCDKEAASSG